MKRTFNCLLVSAFFLTIAFGMFGLFSQMDAAIAPTRAHTPAINIFGYYAAALIVLYGFHLSLIEGAYWLFRLTRRRKAENHPTPELPLPHTQPLRKD